MGPVINCAIYEGGLKIRDLDINNPEDMKVLDGGDDRQRAGLIAEQLGRWKEIRSAW